MKEFDEDLEVALSGGGFRATAFTLGVLLYLSHSGLNRKVKTITSVSGGSITNGFIARECDYVEDPSEVFKDVASRLARKVCGEGKYRGFWLVSWSYAALLVVTGLALLCWATVIAVPLFSQLIWDVPLRSITWREVGFFVLVVTVWGVVGLCREYVIKAWMWFTFFRGKPSTLGSVSGATTDHVFCATDLTSGSPIFFSTKGGGRVFNGHYGRGDAENLSLTRIVQASAAFPPVVPPMRFSRDDLGFDLQHAPKAIYLSDGGVWNNLGTDWSRLREELLTAEVKWFRRKNPSAPDYAGLKKGGEECPMAGVLLIANASKPEERRNLWTVKIPFWSFIAMLARVVGVTVNSTVAARAEDVERTSRMRMLNDPDRWELGVDAPRPTGIVWGEGVGTARPLAVLVEMDRLPGETAEAYSMIGGLKQWEGDPEEYSIKSNESLQKLDQEFGLTKKEVVPTTLDNLGPQDTLRMIVLGYLNTRETISMAFANHNPLPIPEAQWFSDLLK